MKIVVVGAGYVGLVTGVCFAEMGRSVSVLEIDKDKLKKLSLGTPTIYEAGLEEMLKRNLCDGRLHFTSSYEEALKGASVCFIAVDTPVDENGTPRLESVLLAARMIAEGMSGDLIVVNKSTVPVGTAAAVHNEIAEVLRQRGSALRAKIVSNPEFLKEGDAIADFMRPERVIIGTDCNEAVETMRQLYAPFMMSHERFLVMDITSAELTKYAANAMLAARISFMNEMARICEETGANIHHIRKGIGADSRIGHKFLYAGPGFGGSCLPKDLRAIIYSAKTLGIKVDLLQAIYTVNQKQRQLVGEKIKAYFSSRGGLDGKTIGILGLAFKPNTDDMREAPATTLIRNLLEEGASLRLYDPLAMESAKKLFGYEKKLHWCANEMEAAEGSDALTLITEWKQFRSLDFSAVLEKMRGGAFFDGRSQYDAKEMKRIGFHYYAIGCPQPVNTQQEAAVFS